MKIGSILWYDFILFKNRFWGITTGFMISPLLYLIAFGWGIGDTMSINGVSYLNFVIPGIIAMSTMSTSYGTLANNINIARTYDKTFEEFMTAPIKMSWYAVGKIMGSALRGLYSAVIIIALCMIFQSDLTIDWYFALIIVLNCLVFSALGFMIGMVIESHADMSKFQNFIITPMSFLCGTFFPVDKMPVVLKQIIWLLPLTQTSVALRRSGEMFINLWIHPLILIVTFFVFLYFGIRLCTKAE